MCLLLCNESKGGEEFSGPCDGRSEAPSPRRRPFKQAHSPNPRKVMVVVCVCDRVVLWWFAVNQ